MIFINSFKHAEEKGIDTMKWIILSNKREQKYDLDGALHDTGVDWYKKNQIETGDIVYIYESKPEQYIRYKCRVTDSEKYITTFDDSVYGGYPVGCDLDSVCFETQLEYEFQNPITLEMLAEHGISTKRIPVIKETSKPVLFEYLEQYEASERSTEFLQNTDEDIIHLTGEERDAVVKVRVNQGKFRQSLLNKYPHCSICGVSDPALLNASHIKRWVDSTGKEKTDPDNGLLLCPNHDRLFDKGFISFDEDGKILISNLISESDRIFMNVSGKTRIEMNDKMKEYMGYHRKHYFRNDDETE